MAKILRSGWGFVECEWKGYEKGKPINYKKAFKDVVLFGANKPENFDWRYNERNAMHHYPGYRLEDIYHFIPKEHSIWDQKNFILLSTGRENELNCPVSVINELRKNNEVVVAQTQKCIDLYNDRLEKGKSNTICFIHTTC